MPADLELGTVTIPGMPAVPTVEVAGLPAGRSFVLENLSISTVSGPAALHLLDNAGRVHLEFTNPAVVVLH